MNIELKPGVHSPEKVHEALRIVYRRDWLPPMLMIAVVIATAVYLLVGTIPVTGKGNAIFITRETVVPFQSTGTGQIVKWYVKPGDKVESGQLLALLDQPATKKQLEQAYQELEDLKV